MEPGPVGRYLPPGERVELIVRPSPVFILVHRWGLLIVPVLMLAACALAPPFVPAGVRDGARLGALVLVAAYLVVGVFAWLSRRYALTSARLLTVAGVLGQAFGDVPLRNIQHVTIFRSLLERLLGLGTLGVATAGSDGAVVHWRMIPRPERVLERVRAAAELASRPAPGALPVIGLAGGIGSGKSEVARILAGLGCLVTDSDAEARAALDEPDLRRTLAGWWGGGVLDADGRVDRRAVAAVVFKDPEQRRRLEGLVHPILHRRRAEARARAAALPPGQRPAAFVIDAPLLFEAGVDAECDAIIFVDAPREARLARVAGARGWDEAELGRREAAQLPPEEKRRRSHVVVKNDSDREALRERTREALDRALALSRRAAPRESPGGGFP